MSSHKVFVYGTIRKKDVADHWLGGYQMYDAGPYPYILPSDDPDEGLVWGELIEVDAAQLAWFDQYEGVPSGLYTRETVTVYSAGAPTTATEAFVYVGGERWPRLVAGGEWKPKKVKEAYAAG